VEKNSLGRELKRTRPFHKKARPRHDLAFLGEVVHNKLPDTGTYFLPVFCGGGITSLCCAQAPNPKAVTKRATTMIVLTNFNLSRLLSSQVAPVCLGREERGSNAFLKFFNQHKVGASFTLRSQLYPGSDNGFFRLRAG